VKVNNNAEEKIEKGGTPDSGFCAPRSALESSTFPAPRSDLGTSDLEVPGRIMVVDDDIRSRKALAIMLKARGFDVTEAQSGEELLNGVIEVNPDAILLDVMMPGMSGVEACGRIRENPKTAGIPVLLITAVVDREHRLKGLAAGARDFIGKPVEPDELVLRVGNAVQAKKLADRVRKSHDHVQKLETLKGHLMHMIVHDVRAPLMVIQGYLELLKDDEEKRLNQEYTTYVDEAMTGAATVIRMVNALYDIDALEGGNADLRFGNHDLIALTQKALDSLGPAPTHAAIQWERPDKPIEVNMDAQLMERVMANLTGHAVRQTPDEGVVKIAMAREEKLIRVEVSDGGTPIPTHQQEHVFEKFGQVHAWERREVYSTGLGLAFCKLAVEVHGGQIGMKSKPHGQGNILWFTLPLNEEKEGVGS